MRRVFIVIAVIAVLVAAALFASMHAQQTWETQGRLKWPARGEYVARPDGRQLRVWCAGAGTPTVIFEATGVSGADGYEELLKRLGSRAKTCAYDRSGFGHSIGAPVDTIEALGDDLWAVAQHVAPEGKIVLVGSSYGGVVTQYVARKHGDQLAGLVLVDAAGVDAFEQAPDAWAKLESSANTAATLSKLGLTRMIDPFTLGDTREAWLTYRPQTWETARALMRSRTSALAALKTLPPLNPEVPLRVLRHDKVGDLLGPVMSLEEHQALEPKWVAAQEALAASSPNGKLTVATGVGHYIAIDAPELVDLAVRDVLGKPPSAVAAP